LALFHSDSNITFATTIRKLANNLLVLSFDHYFMNYNFNMFY